mmetsp:Transcript_5401/g.19452  ORF Transcript_5401/g.19452 Transcript_5401/m.19452 type:complete len:221 (-) Transcript_5401:590-1252(-)
MKFYILYSRYTRSPSRQGSSLVHGVHDDLPGLQRGEPEPLVVHRLHQHKGENEDPLDSHELSLVVLWLRGPRQEGGDVLGHLGLRGGGSVVVLHAAVRQHLWHGDGPARKVRVVVQPLPHGDPSGGVPVSEQKGEHVVLSVVPRLGDQRQVWRVRTPVREPRSLLVWVRPWQGVRELGRPVEHLPRVVRPVHDLVLLGHLLDLVLRVRDAHQVPVMKQGH